MATACGALGDTQPLETTHRGFSLPGPTSFRGQLLHRVVFRARDSQRFVHAHVLVFEHSARVSTYATARDLTGLPAAVVGLPGRDHFRVHTLTAASSANDAQPAPLCVENGDVVQRRYSGMLGLLEALGSLRAHRAKPTASTARDRTETASLRRCAHEQISARRAAAYAPRAPVCGSETSRPICSTAIASDFRSPRGPRQCLRHGRRRHALGFRQARPSARFWPTLWPTNAFRQDVTERH
ncbi:MAG: hypothetical protein JWN27_458 [Candidatus Eremiobacteraeota bacterium]|nr:hypothetical protein [Candidatus Eremiobacteraeota bacterium]